MGFQFKVLTILLVLFYSNPVLSAEKPEWTGHPSRKILNGDILHFGMGLGETPGVALALAEQMAIHSMVIECSLAHKNILISNRYLDSTSEGFEAYAQSSLSFDDCEEAKNAKGEMRKILESEALKGCLDSLRFFDHQSDFSKSKKDDFGIGPIVELAPFSQTEIPQSTSQTTDFSNEQEQERKGRNRTYLALLLELPGVTSSIVSNSSSVQSFAGIAGEWRFVPQVAVRLGLYQLADTSLSNAVYSKGFFSSTTSSVYGSQRTTLSIPIFFNDPDDHFFTWIVAPEYVSQKYNARFSDSILDDFGSDFSVTGWGGFFAGQFKLSSQSRFIFRGTVGGHFYTASESRNLSESAHSRFAASSLFSAGFTF